MNLKNLTLLTVYCLSLFGCAKPSSPPRPLSTPLLTLKAQQQQLTKMSHFVAKGKVSFSDGNKGGHASIEWSQSHHRYRVMLMGPLGIGSLQIIGEPSLVSLTTAKGDTFQAKTPEGLVKQSLGWAIPISPLQYWLRGLPAPGLRPTSQQLDSQNRLHLLQQHGWTIQYQAYTTTSGLAVPRKMVLKSGQLQLKFIFNEWHS
jgi:outer membrane lipoprotein LolB